ncbi:MAG: IS66 family insertion sequence element accessory protein TnpB [Alphaproteobacteria bacterium]|nr:IS66 family insertion sequence element accessory protein TnpB [Alphaproteobacteria bacterium]MBU1549374.1 IS66 family insertion sequence element accessory protein TnpB [Alphaproteobacteria bacterium]MBU2338139.1 IS66 family insertion sequence element accessory protein TnpB [Alphaproteobacteria bacterium]MBU2387526.1 IS66 family insertion sequence element accessory protein TnpB [Alphaproteobacteria bacterium]
MKIINMIKSSGCPESDGGMHYEAHCADRIKLLWWDGQGFCLFYKILERGYFPWPTAKEGVAHLTQAQLSMLVEGIDWRRPAWTSAPARMG